MGMSLLRTNLAACLEEFVQQSWSIKCACSAGRIRFAHIEMRSYSVADVRILAIMTTADFQVHDKVITTQSVERALGIKMGTSSSSSASAGDITMTEISEAKSRLQACL